MRGNFENLDQIAKRDVLLHGDGYRRAAPYALDPGLAQPRIFFSIAASSGEKPDCGCCSPVRTSSRSARVEAAFHPNKCALTRVSHPSGCSLVATSPSQSRRSLSARFA